MCQTATKPHPIYNHRGESDNFLAVSERDALADSLKQFWETESIGILDPASSDDYQ